MALSQFVEPYSAEQVQGFIEKTESRGKTLEQWELDAYNFRPLPPHELLMLSGDELAVARYVRAACVRINTSSLTKRSIDRGRLSVLDFDFIFSTVLSDEQIQTYQQRLLGSEQGIRLGEATEFVKLICDVKRPIQELANKNVHYAANYYLKQSAGLPRIDSASDLPNLQEISFVKDASGEVIGDYYKTETTKIEDVTLVSRKNRRRLPTKAIPLMIKKALVSVEDRRFWNFKPQGASDYEGHPGVDLIGIIRAFEAVGSDSVQGASTLTMQLAKNLLLHEDVFKEHHFGKRSLIRKLNEYILVKRLESALSKDEILDWYLNTIYFGRRSEGIVMAARSYFGKELEALNLEEVAFLAGLPKSPNTLDPQKNYDGALLRRNIVINQMGSEGHVSVEQKEILKAKPINYIELKSSTQKEAYAHFYTSAVEKQMKDWLVSLDQNPNLGFDITVPINHEYQKWAVESLQKGLLKYERRKGGSRHLTVKPSEDRLPNIKEEVAKVALEKGISELEAFPEVLKEVSPGYVDASQFKIGVILSDSKLGLDDGTQVRRQTADRNGKLSKLVDGSKRNLEVWDTVLLQLMPEQGSDHYRIASFTKIQGGIVVLDNNTGAVLATSGGFSVGAGQRYKGVPTQRAFSAFRQPGSTVKPFTYLFALSKGVSPSDVVSNANVTFPRKRFNGERVCNQKTWGGSSSEASSYLVRNGLIRSKNRATLNTFARSVGLYQGEDYLDRAETLGFGIDEVLGLMQRFGLYTDREYLCYPALLGAEETTVVEMAGAYGAIANGGAYNTPYTINQVSRRGRTVSPFELQNGVESSVRQAILEASNDRQFNNISRLRPLLQGVVQRGTARSISKWSSVIAGKTGTTNSNKDTWFVGFNKEVTVAVWVGYPDNTTLGGGSEGGNTALPVFESFMEEYYAKFPDKLNDKFEGVTARIEPNTGFRVSDNFQSEYQHYTGRTGRLSSTLEYYASEDEKRSQAVDYYNGSSVAGSFFFDQLTPEYKAWYENEYNQTYQTQIYSRYTRAQYDQAKANCDNWLRQGYSRSAYWEVEQNCAIRDQFERDAAAARANAVTDKPSLREYFLNRIQFNY